MQQEIAETMALQALAWLIGQDELLPVFLGATGTAETDLRHRTADPEFLGSVLDFILMDDAWVIACAASLDCPPDTLSRARAALPGGDLPNWT